jgi:hypothetical protein
MPALPTLETQLHDARAELVAAQERLKAADRDTPEWAAALDAVSVATGKHARLRGEMRRASRHRPAIIKSPRTFGDLSNDELRRIVFDKDASPGEVATAAAVLRQRNEPVRDLAAVWSRAV